MFEATRYDAAAADEEVGPLALERVRMILRGDSEGAGHAGGRVRPSQHCFTRLLIGGEYMFAEGRPCTTFHPPTGEAITELVPGCSERDAASAVEGAVRAFPDWEAAGARKRGELARTVAELVREGVEMLADVESADTGRSWYDCRCALLGAACEAELWAYQAQLLAAEEPPEVLSVPGDDELRAVLDTCTASEAAKYAAQFGVSLEGRVRKAMDLFEALRHERRKKDRRNVLLNTDRGVAPRWRALGVVCLMPDCVFPVHFALREMIPALIAGNSVVLLAPAEAPLPILALGHIVQQAGLPPGVVSIVSGQRAEGVLRTHPCVGSLPPPLPHLAPAALIVFDDVEPDEAAAAALKGMLAAAGQLRTSHSRLLLKRGLGGGFADDVLRALRNALQQLPYLDEPIEEHELGDRAWEDGPPDCILPLASAARVDSVQKLVEQQKRKGGELLSTLDRLGFVEPNPPPEGDGYWFEPVVFVEVPKHSVLWRTRAFGPVLAVRFFDTEEEAVEMVNETGTLAAGCTIMTRDPVRSDRMSRRVRSMSTAAVSECTAFMCEVAAVPRGGRQCSWAGRRAWGHDYGIEGLHRFMACCERDPRPPAAVRSTGTADLSGSSNEGDEDPVHEI